MSMEDADEFTPPETAYINCIGIRAPPFWPEKPAVWFVQLEGQFVLAHITQDTTFVTRFHSWTISTRRKLKI
jgi:hypothetical protein